MIEPLDRRREHHAQPRRAVLDGRGVDREPAVATDGPARAVERIEEPEALAGRRHAAGRG